MTTTRTAYGFTCYARTTSGRAAGRASATYKTRDAALAGCVTRMTVVVKRERVSVGEQPDGTVYDWVGDRYTMLAQGIGGTMRGVETVAPIF